MKKLPVLYLAAAIGVCGLSHAADQNMRHDQKNPAIPATQQSGWDDVYDDLRAQLKNAEVLRTTEGITITFADRLLFKTESADLQAPARSDLDTIARIVNKHQAGNIVVFGHADAKGTQEFNQQLSEKRAASVAGYLNNKGVAQGRLIQKGFGEKEPVATNSTTAGRQQNRRVDILLVS